MDELLTEFIAETQETLEALSGMLVSWEADPGDGDRLDAIFRFFHTVKGSCGFLNLPRFERLSHAAEDVLSHVREGKLAPDAHMVNAVLAIMDRISELCVAVSSGEPLPDENDDTLIQSLQDCFVEKPAGGEGESAPSAPERKVVLNETGDAGARTHHGPRTIRLPLTLIDQLMNGVSDMVLARNELSRKLRGTLVEPELELAFERLSSCVADMRDTISKTRMQRVERLFVAIPRMARDLGRELGKSIELSFEGGDVEMDREMVEMVVDPLTHIVRNSIDHGIETPAQRRAAGKPEIGHLRLSARQSGSQIVIEVSDDGRGIDVDAVAAKVVANGIYTTEQVAVMPERERLELIFTPGLSTAREITAISGRGVGMDVVRANVERLGGTISLNNRPGQGLTIVMRVPLTLTIIPGLILQAGGQKFAIPRSAVIEILHDNNSMVEVLELSGAQVAVIRGARYSMVNLEDVIGLPVEVQPGPRTLMLVRSGSGTPYALAVARVDNHEELVIRPAAPVVMNAGVYGGMTLPDSGQPLLLLDATGVAQVASIAQDVEISNAEIVQHREEEDRSLLTYPALKFQDCDGEERLIRLSLVERVEDLPLDRFDASGGMPFVRLNTGVLPSYRTVDASMACEQDQITCLLLQDDDQELYYPIRAVIDIVDAPEKLDMAVQGDLIAGIVLVDGQRIEVIDSHALFARMRERRLAPALPVRCLIADGEDGWNRDILAPLLRQAGYEVCFGLTEQALDDGRTVILSTAGTPLHAEGAGHAPVLRLRSSPTGRDPADPSIYRYDRDGLLRAIATVISERRAS